MFEQQLDRFVEKNSQITVYRIGLIIIGHLHRGEGVYFIAYSCSEITVYVQFGDEDVKSIENNIITLKDGL